MPGSRRPSPVGDRHWRGSARLAAGGALAFRAMTTTLSAPRALPAGPGRPTARGP
ncbi:hypothetical protein [Streptomyces sp. NPDC005799]|uniref:hypothetical protein n=1 Tax=Streptomyces sp. NPDC005799 TaxID=3154678 RepID=UPI003411B658